MMSEITGASSQRLAGRRIVLGVAGSIAAYKGAEIARLLVREGAAVRTVMTDGAAHFIAPLTFETLTGQPVYREMFEQPRAWEMEHITWARWGEAILVAPATANVLAKLANGLSDDPLSALCLAREPGVPLVIAPAMNTQMWLAPATQRNVRRLREDGAVIIEPGSGDLACREVGPGRLADPPAIVDALVAALTPRRDLEGRQILVTAGPTREALDAVRVLTNPSTGKMGFALAAAAARRGARVTLVSGPADLATPAGAERIEVVSAAEMWQQVQRRWENQDAVIFAAAVSDFRPAAPTAGKRKKSEAPLTLTLEPTPDIAAEVGRLAKGRERPLLIGFAAETSDVEAQARAKLAAKGFALIVANEIGGPDTGFASDTDRATLIGRDGAAEPQGLLPKTQLAERILDRVAEALRRENAPPPRGV
jgi:phosphopantothenoylcysteine decarboxylase/phosphopantothenate--cysteine ligase